MSKNKGFTLVELLVVIVLISSITTIAIVSFNNISNTKKKEAYEIVKTQVETAAEQYFSSNEYLLSSIDQNGFARISIGKLVSSDYLNKIINPVTGEAVSYCNYIDVKKLIKVMYINILKIQQVINVIRMII